jgi:hypothetical protein
MSFDREMQRKTDVHRGEGNGIASTFFLRMTRATVAGITPRRKRGLK